MEDSVFYEAVSRCLIVNEYQQRSCEKCPLVKENGCKYELLVELWNRASHEKDVPALVYFDDNSDKVDAFCGKCQGHIYSGLPCPSTGEYEDKPEYCSYCGQKINWLKIKMK